MPQGNASMDRYARHLGAGERLFEEGDPGDSMYVVQSGRIRLFRRVGPIEVNIAILGPGELLGEMAVLEALPRTACAVAADASVVVELDRRVFESMVKENGEIALRILRKLSARLREADRQIGAFLTSSGVVRAVELLRGLAKGGSGTRRELPPEFGAPYLATLAGVPLREAEEIERRLRLSGIVQSDGAAPILAPDAIVDDYLHYLELGQRYDPVPASELAGVTGLAEEEVHRIVQKLLDARLAAREHGAQPLADSYQKFLSLKKRFEYAEHEEMKA
ncbi:MAG TPA: Crp/Fnr family transcriptional regulator [Myxococcales bacterium]|nr:Crp/Fnr family transcriptional regulator [Myxococcales bacterium]